MDKIAPSIEDAALIEFARDMHKATSDRLAEFTGFDSGLDGAWLIAWNDKIEEAENIDSNESYNDEVTVYTAMVDKQAEICMNLMRELKYYAAKAFTISGASFRVYRFAKLHEMVKSTPRFIIYCSTAHRFAVSMNATLLAAGMPAGLPADLLAAITTLNTKEIDKEVFIQSRMLVTEQRTTFINQVYEFMRSANAVASNIYREKQAQLKMFDLPTPKKKENKEV